MKKIFTFFCLLFLVGLVNGFSQNSWTQKSNYPGAGPYEMASFTIDNIGYVGTGATLLPTVYKNDLFAYNPQTDTWTQKANFPGIARYGAIGFSVNGKGYMGLGWNEGDKSDLWEYNPSSDSWIQKANYPGNGNRRSSVFVVLDKAYVVCGMGTGSTAHNQVWEYNPLTDLWTQKANFPGSRRYQAISFSIDQKGYFGSGQMEGWPSPLMADFWEYDPLDDAWVQKSDLPVAFWAGIGFSIGNYGFAGTGPNATAFYEYSPISNTWTIIPNIPITRTDATAFSIGTNGYVLGGGFNSSMLYDTWEISTCIIPTQTNDTTTYFVSSPEFQTLSPKTVFELSDTLSTQILGCDSIVHRYSKFVYNPTYCTDTIYVTVVDTNYVTLTDTIYISVTDTLIINAVLTGVSPPNNVNTIKVYPNPASTHIYIDNGDFASMTGYIIKIINSLGQTVFNQEINQQLFYIDLSGWTGDGTYFVYIIDSQGNIIDTKKIILQ